MWKCKVLLGKNKLQISVPLAAIDALCFYVDFVKSSTLVYSLLLNSRGKKIVQLFLSIVVFHDWILFAQHLSFLILFFSYELAMLKVFLPFPFFWCQLLKPILAYSEVRWIFLFTMLSQFMGPFSFSFSVFFIWCVCQAQGYIRKKVQGLF